ncbi:MAG: nucleoside 2-deoxyribosyltransferase [Pseudomonadota bacterium]
MVKVYLAGPDVFYPNAAALRLAKHRICAALGIEGLHPFDNEIATDGLAPAEAAARIYAANIALMDRAEACIANLVPFRGPNVDDGTAFEVGYCIARGLPVFGYDNRPGSYLDKVAAGGAATPAGSKVEDFGLSANLMLAIGIPASGGRIVSLPDAARADGLDAFDACARLLAQIIGTRPAAE